MYSRGMDFKTVGQLPSSIPRPVFYREPSNGADPEGTVRGPQDYLQYEQALAMFLRTPHARASFLEGGLIWRLAKEMSGNALDVEVLSGPSLYVRQFGIQEQIDGEYLWDDSLSEFEKDFIIGMNRTYTGEFGRLFCLIYLTIVRTWASAG